MEIDDRVEPLVRTTLGAAVRRDPDRMAGALSAFTDDETVAEGIRLATAVAIYVLHDQYGRNPTPAEIGAVADRLVELEDWTDVTADEVVTFLTAAYDGTAVHDVLPMEGVIVLAYVIAADLLASCCAESEWWFDYLDRAEAAIEAARPARGSRGG